VVAAVLATDVVLISSGHGREVSGSLCEGRQVSGSLCEGRMCLGRAQSLSFGQSHLQHSSPKAGQAVHEASLLLAAKSPPDDWAAPLCCADSCSHSGLCAMLGTAPCKPECRMLDRLPHMRVTERMCFWCVAPLLFGHVTATAGGQDAACCCVLLLAGLYSCCMEVFSCRMQAVQLLHGGVFLPHAGSSNFLWTRICIAVPCWCWQRCPVLHSCATPCML